MVSSTTRKIISLAISLLVVVISLTGVALGATVPSVATLTNGPNGNGRYTPGFTSEPGKMVRDAAGNFYVTDFWGKGIVKLNSQGVKIGFIATNGRPTAVFVLPDSKLIVAISKPTPKIAFYSQATGAELSTFGTPAQPLFNPVAITVDPAGNIYVLDSGDTGYPSNSPNIGRVRVYSSAGSYLYAFGGRTSLGTRGDTVALGLFKMPMGIAYEKESTNIVVADTMNSRLQFFANYSVDPLCSVIKKLGLAAGTEGGAAVDNNTAIVKFADPTEIAFEYNGTVLNRIYATERGKGAILAIDPVNQFSLKRIDGSTVTSADMKYPSGLSFEKTATGGVLYVSNAATSTNPANVLALAIDSGTILAQSVTMTMSPIPPTTSAATITVTGTTTPATNVTCSVNGGADTAAGNGNWSAVITLVDNSNNYIRCQSTSGGAYAEGYIFKGAATTAPVIAITQPATSTATTATVLTVSGTADMANTTVQLANSLNGYTISTLSGANNTWSAVINLAAGSNLITATGSKPGTETSTPVSVTVISDSTPPVLTVSSLNSGSTTNEAVQNVDGFVVDANLDTITVNGVNVPSQSRVTISENLTYFSVPLTLVRGANTITVTAKDVAGNTPVAPYTSSVTLNPEIPGLTVALPADNSFMQGVSTASASGTVDTSFGMINITTLVPPATTTVVPSAGVWATSTDFAVSDSLSPYIIKASGGITPEVTVKRTILSNALYSKLAITDPPADLAVNASSITIKGEVSPGFTPAPQISIDGAAYVAVALDAAYATTGKFSYTVASLAEGQHIVKVKADATTAVRNVTRDTVIPQLSVQADTKSMPTTINGSLEPSAKIAGITAALNLSPVVIPVSRVTFDTYNGSGSVTWHADLTGYSYDSIAFSSLDPAGNLNTIAYEKGIPTGDIDGDGTVRLADALAALRHVAGTEVIIDPTKFFNGDVGGLVNGRTARDGSIDITDSVLILNKAYGLMTF